MFHGSATDESDTPRRTRRRGRNRRRTVVVAGAAASLLGLGAAWKFGVGAVEISGLGVTAGPLTTSCSQPRTLSLVTEPETVSVLNELATAFKATRQGRCVEVEIQGQGPGVTADALAGGFAGASRRPDAWLPSSSLWLARGQAAAQERGQRDLANALAPSRATKVASSPTVLGIPEPMAQAVGLPARAISWKEIAGVSFDPKGWGLVGHPEWGPLRMLKADPRDSTTGLNATLSQYYAAAGRTQGMSPDQVIDGRTRYVVAAIERAAASYPANGNVIIDQLKAADAQGETLQRVSAAVLSLQQVSAYNAASPTVRLVAAIPAEGTFTADYPYMILPGAPSGVDAASPAGQFGRFIASTEARPIWSAAHYGQPNGSFEPKLEVPSADLVGVMLSSWGQLRRSANVLTVIDVSGSMASPIDGSPTRKIDAAKRAAGDAIDLYGERDSAGLWSFSGGKKGVVDYKVLVPLGPMGAKVKGAPRREVFRSAVRNLKLGTDTGLYNTTAAAYQAMIDRTADDKATLIVLITDGRNDAEGGLTLAQLLSQLKRPTSPNDVRILTIAYGPDADRAALQQIADATGGASFYAPTAADLVEGYAKALTSQL